MMFMLALAMGIAVVASPTPSPAPSSSPSASPVPSPSASPPPASSYTLRCAGYGAGTFAAAGILVAIPKALGADPSASVFAPSAMAPLATRRGHVTIELSSGTLAASYWAWFAQGAAAKPVDCEIDRDDVDVTLRARFAVAGATIHALVPAQPAALSAFVAPTADNVELDAASISLLTF
jgi:hypothetical protein